MGGVISLDSQTKEFLDIMDRMKQQDYYDMDSIIGAASKLRSLSSVSNLQLQKYFLVEPTNVIVLMIKSIETMYQRKEPNIIHGCLHLLARFLPIIAVSVKSDKDIDWLLYGQDSLIEKLFFILKCIMFTPSLLNPINSGPSSEWIWVSMSPEILNARIDFLSLFVFSQIPDFLFHDPSNSKEQFLSLISMDSQTTKRFVASIINGLKFVFSNNDSSKYSSTALQFISFAMLNDETYFVSLCKSDILSIVIEELYRPIDQLNSILGNQKAHEEFAIEFVVIIFSIMLKEPEAKCKIPDLSLCIIRILQLSNETGALSYYHRLCLTVLMMMTSSKKNCSKLSHELSETLGTKFVFHTQSKALTIMEVAVNSLHLSKISMYRNLIMGIIHNIAPYVRDCEFAPFCFISSFDYLSSILHENGASQLFLVLLSSLKRFLGFEKSDELREKVKKMMNPIIHKYPQDLQDQIINVVSNKDQFDDYPMVIEKLEDSIHFAQKVLLQIFSKRNQVSLEMLRKYAE